MNVWVVCGLLRDEVCDSFDPALCCTVDRLKTNDIGMVSHYADYKLRICKPRSSQLALPNQTHKPRVWGSVCVWGGVS